MAQALEGIRILDLSRIWAGPYATKLMADMGADIIKVESVDRMDTTRGGIRPPAGSGNYPEGEPGEDPWNRNGWFNSLHLSKYGVTINLAKPSGKELFAHLVTISDAVIENYRLGVLARLGFDYEKLRSLRPDIVYISMPAFGNKGPLERLRAVRNRPGAAFRHGRHDGLPGRERPDEVGHQPR